MKISRRNILIGTGDLAIAVAGDWWLDLDHARA